MFSDVLISGQFRWRYIDQPLWFYFNSNAYLILNSPCFNGKLRNIIYYERNVNIFAKEQITTLHLNNADFQCQSENKWFKVRFFIISGCVFSSKHFQVCTENRMIELGFVKYRFASDWIKSNKSNISIMTTIIIIVMLMAE